jgi:hypothetical protein
VGRHLLCWEEVGPRGGARWRQQARRGEHGHGGGYRGIGCRGEARPGVDWRREGGVGRAWQLVKRTEAMGVQMPVQPPPAALLAPHAFQCFSILNALPQQSKKKNALPHSLISLQEGEYCSTEYEMYMSPISHYSVPC